MCERKKEHRREEEGGRGGHEVKGRRRTARVKTANEIMSAKTNGYPRTPGPLSFI